MQNDSQRNLCTTARIFAVYCTQDYHTPMGHPLPFKLNRRERRPPFLNRPFIEFRSCLPTVRIIHHENKIQKITSVNTHRLSNATFWQSAVFCQLSARVKLLKIRARHSSISKRLLQIESGSGKKLPYMHRLMYSINPIWNVPFVSSSLLCKVTPRRHSLKCKSACWPIYENTISAKLMSINQYETLQGLHFYKKKYTHFSTIQKTI